MFFATCFIYLIFFRRRGDANEKIKNQNLLVTFHSWWERHPFSHRQMAKRSMGTSPHNGNSGRGSKTHWNSMWNSVRRYNWFCFHHDQPPPSKKLKMALTKKAAVELLKKKPLSISTMVFIIKTWNTGLSADEIGTKLANGENRQMG